MRKLCASILMIGKGKCRKTCELDSYSRTNYALAKVSCQSQKLCIKKMECKGHTQMQKSTLFTNVYHPVYLYIEILHGDGAAIVSPLQIQILPSSWVNNKKKIDFFFARPWNVMPECIENSNVCSKSFDFLFLISILSESLRLR